MSLAQESGFRPKNTYRKKLAWDIPTRDPDKAEIAIELLRKRFAKASKREKREMRDLMYEASRVLVHMSRNRRLYSKVEQTNFLRLAGIYARLKSEFAQEVGD